MNELRPEMMFDFLYKLPDQFAECLGMEFPWITLMRKHYQNIVVTGLGGSAIGGDILRSYCMGRLSIPVIVNRDYVLPQFVGQDSLVLAVSYSGNTEETLSAYAEARERQTQVIAVTTGGKLAEMAAEDGYPVVKVPSGLVPRAATGYLFAPLALILEQLGLLAGVSAELRETVEVLKARRARLEPGTETGNEARALAAQMVNSIPVIWGASATTGIAAMRWKGQVNENAKSPAYYNVFPELNHNEIVGFEVPEELLQRLAVIILRDASDHPRVNKRMEITRGIIADRVKSVNEVYSSGKSFLSRLYSLIYVGDYASVYLALEYGINPTPVKVIDDLKAKMAE